MSRSPRNAAAGVRARRATASRSWPEGPELESRRDALSGAAGDQLIGVLDELLEAADPSLRRHSNEVLDLVRRVCRALRLTPRALRLAELTALMHDIGKIKVPPEILEKPGPLTPEERSVVELHTLDGERLLEAFGGTLAEVARLIRSSHEHFDGRGYPDGFAGHDIPLVSRIVGCCDAFCAMRSDRVYRPALTFEDARRELSAQAGVQFDPAVVEAVLAVTSSASAERPRRAPSPTATHAVTGALATTELVRESRARLHLRLIGRDRLVTSLLSTGFVIAALTLALAGGGAPRQSPSLLLVLLLVGCHAYLSRVEFEIGSGTFLPTEVALVPMLLLVSPALTPLLVGMGYVLGIVPDIVSGRRDRGGALVRLSYAWHAVGPAAVLLAFHAGPPSPSLWPIYLLAFAAQVGLDAATSLLREHGGVGVPIRTLAPALACAYLGDLLLAPLGYAAALAAQKQPWTLLALVAFGMLLELAARDRAARVTETIGLAAAVEQESSAARRDRLTGLANRFAWEERIERLESAAAGSRLPTSVILVDLDGLKHANDTRGHGFGDRVICTAAALVDRVFGDEFLVARFGGDEFGVLLRGVDECRCTAFVRMLEEAIAGHPGIGGFPLQASVGYGSVPPAKSLFEATDLADSRMYERKRTSQRSRAFSGELTILDSVDEALAAGSAV